MILYPQAQGTLALGIYDDAHDINAERAKTLGRIGMERAMSRRTKWHDEADEWIRYHMHAVFTADDLIVAIGLPTDLDTSTTNNNGVGAYLGHLARRKNKPVLRGLGYAQSDRASSHGRVLRRWTVIGRP